MRRKTEELIGDFASDCEVDNPRVPSSVFDIDPPMQSRQTTNPQYSLSPTSNASIGFHLHLRPDR
jgi:hypothetical protein